MNNNGIKREETNSFVINADLLIILEINKILQREQLKFLKTMHLPETS
jgi:hypothetical protein